MAHSSLQDNPGSPHSGHPMLIAIDSDGCVFDSMTIKQRIFHTGILNFWNLHPYEEEFRRIAEWVALFSPWRGLNRFELLLRIFEVVAEKTSIPVPDPTPLRDFIASGSALSADDLARYATQHEEPLLQRVLEWSSAVSAEIAAVSSMPVFDEAPESLRVLHEQARLVVVSQTAEEALIREWKNAGLTPLVDRIAGAESGSKATVLRNAMQEGHMARHTLMVGDAPGDLEAARAAGCLFFPIRPGAENESWIELRAHALRHLQDGTFTGPYEQEQIQRFERSIGMADPLPPNPVHIITILWGTAYGEEDINRLFSMICRNTSRPIVFHLFSDEALPGLHPDIRHHPEPHMNLPRERNRFGYRKEAGLCDDNLGELTGHRVFFFDLDVLITGSLDELFEYPQDDRFYIIKDWATRSGRVGQATCYSFRVGTLGAIRAAFESDPEGIIARYGTASQEYLSDQIAALQGNLNFWPDPWFKSFRFHCLPPGPLRHFLTPRRPPPETKVLAFHGRPEIRDALAGRWSSKQDAKSSRGWKKIYKACRPTPWIREYWFQDNENQREQSS